MVQYYFSFRYAFHSLFSQIPICSFLMSNAHSSFSVCISLLFSRFIKHFTNYENNFSSLSVCFLLVLFNSICKCVFALHLWVMALNFNIPFIYIIVSFLFFPALSSCSSTSLFAAPWCMWFLRMQDETVRQTLMNVLCRRAEMVANVSIWLPILHASAQLDILAHFVRYVQSNTTFNDF